MIQSETTSTGFIFSPLRVWLGGGGGLVLDPVPCVLWDAWASIPSLVRWGTRLPPTLTPCSVPLPNWRGAFKHKGACKPGPALGSLGSPSTPLLLWGGRTDAEAAPETLGHVLPGRAGSSGSPSYGPSPRPQLPSFLSARHLVLVPSKRMRLGSLPLPVIKASPAQQTPKRPPTPDAAASRRPPWPPHHPGRRPGLGRSTGSPGSENPGLP